MPPLLRTTALIAFLLPVLLLPASATAQERTVSVAATVSRQVPNDTASLGFSVSKERPTRVAALRAVAAHLQSVIAVVQATPGVEPGDVTTGSVSVGKVRRHEHTAFRASEGIGVVLHQPEGAGNLIVAAIRAGATGTRGPNFFVGNQELAFNAALTAAFDKAKAKAAALAAQAGAVLGPALTIGEGSEVEFAPQADQKAASPVACASPSPAIAKRVLNRCAAAPPVKPGDSVVTATVHVVFELQ